MRSSLVCPVRGKYTLSGLLTVTSRPATSRTSLRVAMGQGYDTRRPTALTPAQAPASSVDLRVEGLDPEAPRVLGDQQPGALGQGGDELAGEAEHGRLVGRAVPDGQGPDRKSTRLNSSH